MSVFSKKNMNILSAFSKKIRCKGTTKNAHTQAITTNFFKKRNLFLL